MKMKKLLLMNSFYITTRDMLPFPKPPSVVCHPTLCGLGNHHLAWGKCSVLDKVNLFHTRHRLYRPNYLGVDFGNHTSLGKCVENYIPYQL